ncbi:MAG TPA: ABC transporter ATP-binding protein [Nitrospiraceae bacterium]|nr:ABC transporter ATP-binding protein [Nitrospiraceae bacterium]
MRENSASGAVPAYQVERLTFSYRRGRGRTWNWGNDWALKGISFEVLSGEIFGVVGPNGSGKTSLLKLLAKVLQPLQGVVELFGSKLEGMRQEVVARTVALVGQDTQQIFPFTITETVLMGRFPHHQRKGSFGGFAWEGPEDLRLARQAMEETDVAHLAHRLISEISGGERQRAIIARALAQQPKVLLLDEPTAFLDLNHQLEICTILRRLNEQQGLTVVLSSHDLNLVSQYCDRIMLLNEGTVFCLGTPEEVIRPDVLETVYRCEVLVDRHPDSGLPRVTLPSRAAIGTAHRIER